MKVWIVESGCYDDRIIIGVYATREAAIAANPPAIRASRWLPRVQSHERPGGWQPDDPQKPETCEWSNGLDWGDAMSMWPEEVKE